MEENNNSAQKSKNKSLNYVLAEVYYDKGKISKIKYYSVFENKFFEMPFGLYYNKYRKILVFRNAYLVEGASALGGSTAFFRARIRHKHSFKKIGGSDGTTDFDSASIKQEAKKGSLNGRRCEAISTGNDN